MTILASSVNVDGTVSTTGGTATGLLKKKSVGNDLVTVLDDSSEFKDATVITFTARDPQARITTPNGYTQARSIIKVVSPLALDNGETTKNSVTVNFAVDHETTAAEINSLRVLVAQLLADADFDGFWQSQLLA